MMHKPIYYIKGVTLAALIFSTSPARSGETLHPSEDYYPHLQQVEPIKRSSANWGHRGGSDVLKAYPENTLSVLRTSLLGHTPDGGSSSTAWSVKTDDGNSLVWPIQYDSRFRYLEFDIHETLDGVLVVFHDSTISRMVGKDRRNAEILNELGLKRNSRIDEVHYADLTRLLVRKSEARIPTLKQFLDSSLAWGLRRPIALEVKDLRSDSGRERLFTHIDGYLRAVDRSAMIYEDSYKLPQTPLNIIAFGISYRKAFGKKRAEQERWCRAALDIQLAGIYSVVGKKNYCTRFDLD